VGKLGGGHPGCRSGRRSIGTAAVESARQRATAERQPNAVTA